MARPLLLDGSTNLLLPPRLAKDSAVKDGRYVHSGLATNRKVSEDQLAQELEEKRKKGSALFKR